MPTKDDPSTIVRIHVRDALDLSSAASWQQLIAAQINEHPGAHVVVDLGAVHTIDSAGISSLIASRNHAVDDGGGLSVDGASRAVLELLEAAGVGALLGISVGSDPPAVGAG